MPGVQLTIRNADTGVTRLVVTDGSGNYSAPLLPVGTYEVEAFLDGFAKKVVRDVRLQIDQTLRVDITLELGTVSNEVTVVGEAPLVNTTTSQQGEVIENRRMVELPLNSRQFLALAELNSGASLTSGSFDARMQTSGPRIIMNGQMEQYNHYTVDGTDATDPYYNSLTFSPSVEAIQEFKILTGNYSAEFGGFTGAMVNISTKSGANAVHGSGFEFVRDAKLDARNFFDKPQSSKPPFHQDQFGGAVGGPILPNRLFFFGSYEGLRNHKTATSVVTVPTAGMRNGDLTDLIARGQKPAVDPLTGQPFPGNVIPTSRFDPVASTLIGMIPKAADGGFNLLSQPRATARNNQGTARVDYQVSQSNNMFGRYTLDGTRNLNPGTASYQDALTDTRAHNLTLSDTHVVHTNLINEFRVGLNRVNGGDALPALIDFNTQAGIQGAALPPQYVGVPTFSITGLGSYGGPGFLVSRRDLTWQLLDNMTWVRGSHTMKFGGAFSRYHFSPTGDSNARGSMSFDGTVTGNAYADFLLGIPRSAGIARGARAIDGRSYLAAGYLQDDWKASQRLTLNLGLRYEYLAPVTEIHGKIANLDIRNPSKPQFVVPNSDTSVWVPGMASRVGIPIVTAKEAGLPTSLIFPTKRDFAPRIGFAYQPFGSDTVIRGGYGIFYANPSFNWAAQLRYNPPMLDQLSIQNVDRVTSQYVFLAPSLGNTSGYPEDPNFRVGYTQQYFANYQAGLGETMLLEVSYVGSKGSHLMKMTPWNKPLPGPGPLAARRPIPVLATFNGSGSNNHSLYNALQARFERRMNKGIGFTLQYSLAQAKDLQSYLTLGPGGDPGSQNPLNPEADWGLAVFDHKNRFVGNFVAELPFGPGRRFVGPSGFVRALIAGWQVSGIVTLQDGTPFSVTSGVDRSNTGGTDRPNLVGNPNLPGSQRTVQKFFNTAAFVLNDPYTYGNVGRGIMRGPNFRNVDVSLVKRNALIGSQSLDFRVEAFNVLNRPNFNLPGTNLSSLTFGRITSAKDGRIIQLAVKYHF